MMKQIAIVLLLICGWHSLNADNPWGDELIPVESYARLHNLDLPAVETGKIFDGYLDEIRFPRYIREGCEKSIVAFWHDVPMSCVTIKNLEGVCFTFSHNPRLKGQMEITDQLDPVLVEKLKMSKRHTVFSRDINVHFYEYIIDGREVPKFECGNPLRFKIRINFDDDFKFYFKDCADIKMKFSSTPDDTLLEKFVYPSD